MSVHLYHRPKAEDLTLADVSVEGFDVNTSGLTGEIGIDFNSISSTYSTICQSDAEGISVSSDLRIGLDETNRTLIICDRGDIATDFGRTAESAPTLVVMSASTAWKYCSFTSDTFDTNNKYTFSSGGGFCFTLSYDMASGNAFTFDSTTSRELTDADAEQAWIYLEPEINQTSTAGYIGLLMDVTETSTGSGTNALMDLRIATASKFMVDNSGNITNAGNFKMTENSDFIQLTHDGTDAYFKTDDGSFIFVTDEGTNTNTLFEIKGKGSGYSDFRCYDNDDAEYIRFYCSNGVGCLQTGGTSPGRLEFQYDTSQDLNCWAGISSGNPSLVLYGWNTAGGDRESTELTMDDTNDEFLIQAADSANHEGITVSLPEANQKFRIRDGSTESIGMYTGGIIDLTGQTITTVNASGTADLTDWADQIGVDNADDPMYALEIKVGGTSYYLPCFTAV